MSDQITFQNSLDIDVNIYDSFSSEDEENYYGKLTFIATMKANTTMAITPVHSPVSVQIAFDTDGNPIGRYVAMFDATSFNIDSQDLAVIQETEKFVDYIIANPKSDLATQFHKTLDSKSDGSNVKAVDAFFQKNSDYKDCTFASYMLVLTHKAQTPASASQPVQDRAYSLSMLCNYLSGASWPSGFPDIDLKDFQCCNKNDILKLGGIIELTNLPFENTETAKNILSLFPVTVVEVLFMFDYQVGLNLLGTRIQFVSPDFHIPVGDGKSITIAKPTITLDISPLFAFVVFEASSCILFDIFGHKFEVDISMAIDNVEAEIGTVIEGDHNALPSPSAVEGVHFDQFGVGMGIVFEPPSFALGLQGEFHIGSGSTVVQLDDNTFALICSFEEEVPNPLYISFYVPKLDVPTLVEVFTDTTVDLDIPVSFSDLSFTWSENPMEPLLLPDGTMTQMAFGFSGYMDLFGLQYYGQLEIDLKGVEGTIAMSPLSFGKLLNFSGDGKAITVKVDKNGNPIKNNQVAKTKEMKDAIANATTKQIIAPGGPEMRISTSSSPYFSLDSQISLFDVVNRKIDAEIAKDGIKFELDYGAVISSKMKCALKDYHNFSGSFSYGLNLDVPLPAIAGFSLGSIDLDASCNLGLAISTSTSDLVFSVQGGFEFADLQLNFGPYSEDVNISSISDLLSAVGKYIIDNAGDIFKDFINDASRWAGYVKNAVVKGVKDVAQGLKTAFNQTAEETASIMNSVGYSINETADAIKDVFGASASELGKALSAGFGATEQGVASALKYAGFGAEAIASGLSDIFGSAPTAISDILQGIGYGTDTIKDAFESLGGSFADFASDAWGAVKDIVDPSKW